MAGNDDSEMDLLDDLLGSNSNLGIDAPKPVESTPTKPTTAPSFAMTPPTISTTPGSFTSKQRQAYTTPKSKATANRSKDSRLPTARHSTGSVFDRLYRTPTVASKYHFSPVLRKQPKTSPSPLRTPNSKAKSQLTDDDLNIFSRLYVTSTASVKSKTFRAKHPRRSSPKNKGVGSPHNLKSPSRSHEGAYVFSPRMKPRTKLYFSSRYHPGVGLETVEPLKLGYTFFQSFCEYENDLLTPQKLAEEIIQAFFKQDFHSEET
jgi:hypothetical protein